jgi:succinyl-diaminopimelate desuccinylase
MVDQGIFERITKRIDSYTNEMLQLQINLTAIPALAPDNGGDGEQRKAQFITTVLHEFGFNTIKEYCAPDERVTSGIRPNIVATIPGKNRDKTVWIMTHMDIVPPGELNLWDDDPYKGYVKEGNIYGRGTEDNQQDLVASIFAVKAFLDEGIMPESSIGLVFVADEETGSKHGLTYILENHPDLFQTSDIIVVPDFGDTEGSAIEIAEKSILWLRFKTTGKQCHASKPSLGRNAFMAASHLVVKLNELYQMFDISDPIYQPPESTFEPTKKEANIPNINTIPGEDVFYMDCRVLPIYTLPQIESKMRDMANEVEQQFGVSIEITPVQHVQAPPPTPHDAHVVSALHYAIKAVYDIHAVPVGIGGGTIAAVFRQHGYQAAVWSRLNQMAHQPNEYCKIDNMIGNTKVYAHLLLQKS